MMNPGWVKVLGDAYVQAGRTLRKVMLPDGRIYPASAAEIFYTAPVKPD